MRAVDLVQEFRAVQSRADSYHRAGAAALRAVVEHGAPLTVLDPAELESTRNGLIQAGRAYDDTADRAGLPVVHRFAWQSYLLTAESE